ncbi:hypothetical protein KY290_001034 [Solanum tuberosum]|uniref:Uncharacterized protein n=1 Tax=Solanum tuberosum TaxID=4113 RepID=A0ABQ7WL14_SOLTU|nr:hypothetical protein KY290_001034 [Solanum tuberosum]
MRWCPHNQNIKREYEELPELHHSQLEPKCYRGANHHKTGGKEVALGSSTKQIAHQVSQRQQENACKIGNTMLQIHHQQHHGSGKSSPRYSGEGREKPQQMQGPQDQIQNNEAAVTIFEKNKPVADAEQVEKEALALAEFHEPLQVDFTSVETNDQHKEIVPATKAQLELAQKQASPVQVLHEFVSHHLTGITGVAVQINNQDKDGKREDKEEREGHQNINQLVKDPDLSPHAFSKAKKCKAKINSKPTRTLPRRSGKSSINESKSFILKH